MNPSITTVRTVLQRAVCLQLPVKDVWKGPGEGDLCEEFTVELSNGTMIHVQVQEGACPAA